MLGDPEMREFAVEEIGAGARAASPPSSPPSSSCCCRAIRNDTRNAIMEIRAGTGGDESALFAGDLLRMYLRYAERRGWKTEILSAERSGAGRLQGSDRADRRRQGLRPAQVRIRRPPRAARAGDRGAGPHPHLGLHRGGAWPRPTKWATCRSSPDDLRIDVFRASGAGGQHVNKTESAVRITHLPSGIVAECQDDRSQHRNRDKAMKVLLTRLRDVQQRELHAKEAAHRKSLVGSGDRSERIRTYNFPQGRVTDHRINLTLYKLQLVMDGDLDELTDALIQAQIAEQVAALEEAA